jgi:sugar diacid utilization regulator
MKLPLEFIIEHLKKLNLNVETHLTNQKLWTKGVKLFPADKEGLNPEYLYFGTPEDLQCSYDCIILVIVFLDSITECIHDNYIILHTKRTLPSIFNELLGLYAWFQNWELQLEQSLSQNLGPQHLLDLSEPAFGNPIVITDPALKCLASTSAFDTDDIVFSELLSFGYITQHTFDTLKSHDYFTPDHYSGETLILPPSSIKKYTTTFLAVLDGGVESYLILMLFYNYDYSPGVMQLFLYFQEKLISSLKRNLRKNLNYRTQYEFFVIDLLERRCTELSEIEERSQCFEFACPYHSIVIRLVHDTDMYRKHAHLTLSLLFPYTKPVLFQDSIVIYTNLKFSKNNQNIETSTFLSHLTTFLNRTDAYAGISNQFRSYADITKSYHQSEVALSIGKALIQQSHLSNFKGQRIFCYFDLWLYQLIDVSHHSLFTYELCSDLFLEILEYDKNHQTNYLKILQVYLTNERNYTRTAADLYMHRNNVIYHIKRICELFNVDLNNPDLRLQLLLSYKVLDLYPEEF